MDIPSLFSKYFINDTSRHIVFTHSRMVANKALTVAKSLKDPTLDLAFIEEAALLHDIGVCRTSDYSLGCTGSEPYIRHGLIGRQLLEEEGLPQHALVCERHIGVGLTREDIIDQQLPLPDRDMVPIRTEERIICFADLFYSKNPQRLTEEKTADAVRQGLMKFGEHKALLFDLWLVEFQP